MTTRGINGAIADAERNGLYFYMEDPTTGEFRRITRARSARGVLLVLELSTGQWLDARGARFVEK